MTILCERLPTVTFTHSTATSRGEVGARGMALFARPVWPEEVKDNPKAQASLDVEYNALCDGPKALDMIGLKDLSDVQAQAKCSGERIHVGMIFWICIEKNAELPEGHPNRKYKGRFVSQGTTSGTKNA